MCQARPVDTWEDESSRSRCTATHVAPGADGDVTVRCDGQAGHAGPQHQGHIDQYVVRWSEDRSTEDRSTEDRPA